MLSLKEKPKQNGALPVYREVVYTAELWDGTKRSWRRELPEGIAKSPEGPGHALQSFKAATHGFSGDGFFLTPHAVKEITWEVL